MAARPPGESDARLGPGSRPLGWAREARLWLLAAMLIGALRFLFLGRWSLWYDEIVTLADAYEGLEGGGLHNPLGYLAIKAVLAARGGLPDEIGLRLLPAVAGWLCIPLTAWCFAPLDDRDGVARGRSAGLAALLVAASAWSAHWSLNARFYTLAQATSLLGSGLLLRGWLGGSPVRAVAGMALAAAAASLHLSAALVFLALALAPLALLRVRGGLDPRAQRVALLLLLALALVLLVGHRWALSAWRTYLVSKSVGGGLAARIASIGHFVASLGFYVTPTLGVAFLVGALGSVRRRGALELLPLVVVAIGVAATGAAALFGRVTAQYAFGFLPWLAWIAARPAVHAGSIGRALAWAAVLVLPTLADQALYLGLRHGERPRWREAIELVWARRGPQDLVVMMAAPIGEHYLLPAATDLRRPRTVAWMDKWRPDIPQRWYERGRNVWIVVQPENLEDWSEGDRSGLLAFLAAECRLVERLPVAAPGRDLSLAIYYYSG